MALYITGDDEIDGLVNSDALALVIALVLDQQIPLERAFSAPSVLKERLGGELDAHAISAMAPDALAAAFSAKPALHRFPAAMAERVQLVARIIVDRYAGDAAAIWSSAPDGETLRANLAALPGFGPMKAQIAVALLAKQFGVRPPGWSAAAGAFGHEATFVSVADIDGPEALAKVRAHKQEMKAAARAAAESAPSARSTHRRAGGR